MLNRSVSHDSFFKYKPFKPLISSYGKFLHYCSYNNITLNIRSRTLALYMWWNHVDNLKKMF